jgi:hypothetical protein
MSPSSCSNTALESLFGADQTQTLCTQLLLRVFYFCQAARPPRAIRAVCSIKKARANVDMSNAGCWCCCFDIFGGDHAVLHQDGSVELALRTFRLRPLWLWRTSTAGLGGQDSFLCCRRKYFLGPPIRLMVRVLHAAMQHRRCSDSGLCFLLVSNG